MNFLDYKLKVFDVVSEYFEIEAEHLTSNDQSAKYNLPRVMAIHLLNERGIPKNTIAKYMNRHLSSVRVALMKNQDKVIFSELQEWMKGNKVIIKKEIMMTEYSNKSVYGIADELHKKTA